jgi:hypothetical protein
MSSSPDFIVAKFTLAARFLPGASAKTSAVLGGTKRTAHHDPNIIGVAIGEKNGEGTGAGVTSVRMFVKKKLPKAKLSKQQLIPATIDGLPVDVVQTGVFKALSKIVSPQTRLRPAPAGCSVGFDLGDGAIMAGTFGALVRDTAGRLYILSNNHVLAAEDELEQGAAIFQPGLLDGGKVKRDQIASLSKAIKMKTVGMNAVDAAIAEVLKKSDVSAVIPVIGIPTGKRDATRNIIVHKFGRTTSYTSGYITDTDALVQVEYDRGVMTFDGQIVIHSMDRKKFSDSGDSGSLIVEKPTGKAVGLLFAGGTGYTLANPIGAVLKAFKVQLVTKA